MFCLSYCFLPRMIRDRVFNNRRSSSVDRYPGDFDNLQHSAHGIVFTGGTLRLCMARYMLSQDVYLSVQMSVYAMWYLACYSMLKVRAGYDSTAIQRCWLTEPSFSARLHHVQSPDRSLFVVVFQQPTAVVLLAVPVSAQFVQWINWNKDNKKPSCR